MKTKKLTRARKEAQGMKPPTRSSYEMRKADRRASDLRTPANFSGVAEALDEG